MEVLAVVREKAGIVLGVEQIAEDLLLASLDSLALVELAMDVEDAFGVDLTEADFRVVATVGGLVDVVVAKTS